MRELLSVAKLARIRFGDWRLPQWHPKSAGFCVHYYALQTPSADILVEYSLFALGHIVVGVCAPCMFIYSGPTYGRNNKKDGWWVSSAGVADCLLAVCYSWVALLLRSGRAVK